MKKFLFFMTAIVIVFVFASCDLSDDPQGIEYLLYKMDTPTNNKTFYFLGSMHVGNDSLYPMDSQTKAAYDSADILVTELDMTKADSAYAAYNAMFTESTKASNRLADDKTWDDYEIDGKKAFTSEDIKIIKSLIDLLNDEFVYTGKLSKTLNYEPAMLNDLLSFVLLEFTKPELSAEKGVDVKLFTDFPKAKDFAFLETYADQAQALFAIEQDEQMQSFKQTYDAAVSQNGSDIVQLFEMYKKQNPQELNTFVNAIKIEQPSFYQKILVDRNTAWVTKIQGWIASDTDADKSYFVVVGLFHLHGDDSVLAKLKVAGYTISEIHDR